MITIADYIVTTALILAWMVFIGWAFSSRKHK